MVSYANLIVIDRDSATPIYLQIANSLVQYIQNGILKKGTKLPGSRRLATMIQVHRKTVVRALEELEAQGWVQIIENTGSFIQKDLPVLKVPTFTNTTAGVDKRQKSGFSFTPNQLLTKPVTGTFRLAFDDGFPDTRLAPLDELAATQARILRRNRGRSLLSYQDPLGHAALRQALADEFNKNRGLQVTENNIMITKGSQMALFLAASILIKKGNKVVVGDLNYYTSNLTFNYLGASLIKIPVDAHGLDTNALELLCQQQQIRAVFVTSHHHHPTTVTLIPSRRLHLLELAATYRFLIIEDDYDYEFNYGNGPLLPLASADRESLVIYIGSFSKSVAPAIRIGYLVAAEDIIDELGKMRRLIDRQGDMIQEAAFAELLREGTIRRYHKKALKQYKLRRDHAATLLKNELGGSIEFSIPEGGLAFWAKFSLNFSLQDLSAKAMKKQLYLSNGDFYTSNGDIPTATRMGFASMDLGEMEQAVHILRSIIDKQL